MVTPIDENGKIDKESTKRLVNKLINAGVSGLFILGTNGEFYALTDDEKTEFTKIVVSQVAKRVPVFAGTGGIATEEVCRLNHQMAEIGVDAVSIITPYLIHLSHAELVAHYEEIADSAELPIILYNIPQNTGCSLSADQVAQLAKHPKIIGIKDSSGDIENIKSYVKVTQALDFTVLVGSDSLILDALLVGAKGAVAATSNVLTKTDTNIYNLYLENRLDEARAYQESINEFRRILKFATVPSILKYTLKLINYPVGDARHPVLPLEDKTELQEIANVIESYRKVEQF
ncbi:4-hydroxy-tetrahydrodipicolinate synthase [Enterococcus sp. MMGLQ5-2]|nr:4-hydroxy-tetrahydrodipicolinate synthase [Enterococcus sp. MMGLQ5-2]MBS7585602.1 4-hydroxy-tetrahydrodipicolinate synthase [Enterococcus sp. MMGLQ5-1]NPD13461.1 4-hydroxy-tetrahydrodipicolinate synthase [Enterococcus sp. MMGLQ5-1]NPD36342.1 4-hydroxy-tetrahydrodipicolinate synthase [Enterococcus sp. MMGLQ5-2]